MKSWDNCGLPDNRLFPEQYTVREIIHESSTSTVLLGHDAISDSLVVFKCFTSSAKGAYLREINAAFDIKHPNLQSCLNTFHRTDGLPCIVYEYLAGGSLAALLKTQKQLAFPVIVACLQAMLRALVYLNGLNRIHCDIKPENILLRPKADGEVEYVLIDLGAACGLREAQEGQHGVGTPAYIAPERLKNRFFFNSDLYSLGVIAFEMCTGERPFQGSLEELTAANASQIPTLAKIQPAVLRDFIDYLLAKNPKQRLGSAKLALNLLDKAILPSNRLVTNPFLIAESRYAQWVMPMSDEPLNLQCFHIDEYPLIGLVYPHYVDILDPMQAWQPYKTLLTNHPVQLLGNNRLAYGTPSRVQILELGNAQESLIKEGVHDLQAWHVGERKWVWSNTYYYFYDDLSDAYPVKFGVTHYLFNSEVSLLANGSFVTSEGMTNNKIVLRNAQAKILQEWHLDASVIAISHNDSTALVVTMDLDNGNTYTVWCLTENQDVQKLALSDPVSQIVCLNGSVFWLSNKRVLNCCDSSLRPQTLNTFAINVFKFAVSYDHRFIAVGFKNDENQLLLTLLKNRAIP